MRTPIGILIATVAFATQAVAGPEPKTDEEKTFYALGVALSRNLAAFDPTTQELEFVKQGLTDGALQRPNLPDLKEYSPKFQQLAAARAAVLAAGEKRKSQVFLDKAAQEKNARTTDSGLIYVEMTPGTGKHPAATDRVKVHYHGTLIDGTVFDSSVDRGQPATFPLNGVIKCWTEGVQLMKVSGKSKLICPADIAYGDRGSPPRIKPGATLVFDVELLEIVEN